MMIIMKIMMMDMTECKSLLFLLGNWTGSRVRSPLEEVHSGSGSRVEDPVDSSFELRSPLLEQFKRSQTIFKLSNISGTNERSEEHDLTTIAPAGKRCLTSSADCG